MREGTLTDVERLSRTTEADEALDMDEEAFRRLLPADISRLVGLPVENER